MDLSNIGTLSCYIDRVIFNIAILETESGEISGSIPWGWYGSY